MTNQETDWQRKRLRRQKVNEIGAARFCQGLTVTAVAGAILCTCFAFSVATDNPDSIYFFGASSKDLADSLLMAAFIATLGAIFGANSLMNREWRQRDDRLVIGATASEIEALILVTRFRRDADGATAGEKLIDLLPQITEGDVWQIGPGGLRQLLALAHSHDSVLAPLAVQALGKVGNASSLPSLRDIACGKRGDFRAATVQLAALEAISSIEIRLREGSNGASLLRASVPSEETADLLRPVTSSGEEEAQVLLRVASISEREEPQALLRSVETPD